MNAETWKHMRHVLGENPVTMLAVALFALFVLMAIFGPALVPYDPLASNSAVALQPPSAAHWFGTDALGRDIFSRTVVATRLDLGIAVSAVAASFVIGMPLGLAAGFFGGWWDRIVTRLSDTIMAFPLFVLAMGIVAALGNTVGNIVLATAIINLPFYVRVARAEANVRRGAGWIEAARLSGNGDARILAVHLFPNALPPAMVQVSLNMGWAILNAAGLSFIGLGVRPPTPEWGILVAEGAQFIVSGEWWVSFFPGAVLMLAVFSFNLLGDALRDIFDPTAHAHEPAARCSTSRTSAWSSAPAAAWCARSKASTCSCTRARSSAWSAKAARASRCCPMRMLGISDRAARVTGGSAVFGGMDLLTASEARAGRPARARDLDDLPEPAHGAQPDPPRRPAAARTCCAAMPPRPAPTWARA